jgi:hypothetical protein
MPIYSFMVMKSGQGLGLNQEKPPIALRLSEGNNRPNPRSHKDFPDGQCPYLSPKHGNLAVRRMRITMNNGAGAHHHLRQQCLVIAVL